MNINMTTDTALAVDQFTHFSVPFSATSILAGLFLTPFTHNAFFLTHSLQSTLKAFQEKIAHSQATKELHAYSVHVRAIHILKTQKHVVQALNDSSLWCLVDAVIVMVIMVMVDENN